MQLGLLKLVEVDIVIQCHNYLEANRMYIDKNYIIAQYKQLTVGSLSSTTCPPIFMQLTGQNNGGIACPAFLLARKSN